MRRAISVLLVLTLLVGIFAVPAMAAEPRATTAVATLDISGTTATCTLSAAADKTSDSVKAIIKLYRGSTCIATWSGSGDGYLFMSKPKTVTKGYTYKMTVSLTINGVSHHVNDIYKTI